MALGFKPKLYTLQVQLPGRRRGQNDIVRERRGITADAVLRLARYFGTDAQSWINLQAAYDLRVAELAAGETTDRVVKPRRMVKRTGVSDLAS